MAYETAEQLAAVQAWAKQHGRTWKAALRAAWASGDYQGFDGAPLLQQLRNAFGPSWLVSFRLPVETQDLAPVSKVTLSPKSARAVKKYGLDECVKAYARNQEGYGASTIAFENGWRTNQADAAIDAGEEYTVFTTGHALPYGPRHAGEVAPLENLPTATECAETLAPVDPAHVKWMESILAEDTRSTDYELGLFFVAHAVPQKTAESYIARRADYHNAL
jgi:hypothetical protein